MKKLLLALALMLPMVVFTACEKEEENSVSNEKELIGTWTDDIAFIEPQYFQFNADHTGCNWREYKNEVYESDDFTWATSKNILTITFEYDYVEIY